MNDKINSAFEILAGFFLLLNCYKLYKDKEVKGISILSTGFFTLWTIWNLYYYPQLNQWNSFYGSIFTVVVTLYWFALYFKFKNGNH